MCVSLTPSSSSPHGPTRSRPTSAACPSRTGSRRTSSSSPPPRRGARRQRQSGTGWCMARPSSATWAGATACSVRGLALRWFCLFLGSGAALRAHVRACVSASVSGWALLPSPPLDLPTTTPPRVSLILLPACLPPPFPSRPLTPTSPSPTTPMTIGGTPQEAQAVDQLLAELQDFQAALTRLVYHPAFKTVGG